MKRTSTEAHRPVVAQADPKGGTPAHVASLIEIVSEAQILDHAAHHGGSLCAIVFDLDRNAAIKQRRNDTTTIRRLAEQADASIKVGENAPTLPILGDRNKVRAWRMAMTWTNSRSTS